MTQHPRTRRVFRWFGFGLLYLALGVVLLLALVLVSLNLPPVKSFVASKVNSVLAPTFKGKLTLDRLGRVGLGGVAGVDFIVHDPAGQEVLHARDIDVDLAVPSLVWNAVTGSDPLVITLNRIAIDDIDVQLIDDGSGSPTLAHAFEPQAPPEPEEAGGKTAIVIEALRVNEIRVRGALASPGPIDADLKNLEASLTNDPSGTHVVLARLDVAARQLPQVGELVGRLNADVTLPALPEPVAATPGADVRNADGTTTSVKALEPSAAPTQRIVATFDGSVAGSPIRVDGKLEGEALDAKLESSGFTPDTLKRLVPALSPTSPAALFASVQGVLSDLGFEARVTQETARIETRGRVRRQGEDMHLKARIDGSGIDASHLMSELPPTQLNLDGDAELSLRKAGGNGSYQLLIKQSALQGERIPDTTIAGALELPQNAPLVTRGTIVLEEPGAPTRIEYLVKSNPEGVVADIGASAKLERPARVRKLSGGLVLSGEVEAMAHFDSAKDHLESRVELGFTDVSHPSFRARRVDAVLSANGSAKAPTLKLEADLRRVVAAERNFARVQLLASGTPDEIDVTGRVRGKDPALIDLKAKVHPGASRLLERPQIVVSDAQGRATIAAESVSLVGERIRVKKLTLDGPGRAEASLVYGKGLEELELRTEQLRPLELLALFGIKTRVTSANVDLQAKLSGRGQQTSGTVKGAVTEIGLGQLKHGTAQLDLTLERGKVSGQADLDIGRGGKTSLSLKNFRPPLGPVDKNQIERLIGQLSLKGELNLARLSALFPLGGIERAEGVVKFDIAVDPPGESGEHPGWRAQVASKKLVLISQRRESSNVPNPDQARASAPWTLRGIDVDLDAALNREGAKVKGRLLDATGDLITVDGTLEGVDRLQDLLAGMDRLENAPFKLGVHVPGRVLEKLPSPLRPAEVQGVLTLDVDAEGTIKDPRVKLQSTIQRFSPASDRPRERRSVDLELLAEYTRAGGKVDLSGKNQNKPVLDLKTSWKGDAADFAKLEPGGASPVLAELAMSLDEFPVGVIPAVQAAGVRGRLSGKATLAGYGRDAQLDVDLHTKKMRIEQVTLDAFTARIQMQGGKLIAKTELSGDGGKTTIDASAGFVWKDRVVPTIEQDLEGTLVARGLRLGALQPLVAGSLSELDGKLDADMRASLQNGTPHVTGKATLNEGVIQMPSIGQRFDEIHAEIALDPGELRIEKVHAKGVTGAFNLTASAKLEGLTPVSAKASVKINEGAKLPLTIEGEAVGDAWGTIETTYTHDEASKTNTIVVNLDRFFVQLPDASPRGIQSLDAAPDVRVGFRRRDREFVTIPLQPIEEPSVPSEYKTVLQVDVNSLWVEKGSQAEVTLGGGIKATMGETLDVQGKIETRRGQLDISGKTFDIERGAVTFTGEPSNPTISAVARYDSPGGYTVYAEYTGTAVQGKLRLSSEPALSQDEILTLLMFGTPDGSIGAGNGGGGLATAVSVAGGTATQGLNRALSDITDIDVSARIDTSTGAPRPELVLQLTPRVAAKVTQALGEPTPGQSPDRTFLTVELRLASAWSLSTMVGDRGASALDLIWRRRY